MNTRLPMNRKLLTLIFVGLSAAFMSACGNGNSTNAVVIGFSQAPPAVLQTSTVTALDAVVSNDTANKGVDWTVACGGSDCGSFVPTHTASGVSTNYTAPATVPSGNTVTITATATANSSAVATGTVTITTSSTAGGLNGQYSFLVSGADTSGFYVAAGSVIADGNGNITGGEEDLCDLSIGCTTAADLSGTYATGTDGRGSINFSSTSIGPQTLQVAVTSTSHSLVIEFDGNATSSGSLDLQDMTAFSATAISGNYSMALNGLDITEIAEGTAFPGALGGIMTADGASGFTNVTLDINDGGTVSSETTAFAASSPQPDSFGRVAMSDPNFEFVYYIVNAKALRLVEVDQSLFITSGSAYTQGTGSLTVANLAGTSVFTEAGSTTQGSSSLGLAGQMTVDNNGNVSPGFIDVNEGGSVENGSIAGSTFTGFSAARGSLTLSGGVASTVEDFQVYLVDPGVNILDPTNATGSGGALLLDVDTNAIGTGEIIPQTVGAQFSGDYGVNLQAFTTSTSTGAICAECDLVGQVQAGASNLTGTGDLNDFPIGSSFTLVAAQALTGSFTADSSNPGRFTGSLNLATFGTFNLVYYQATNSQLVIVEVDTGQVGTGVIEEQQ
jgi:hypothetical protein